MSAQTNNARPASSTSDDRGRLGVGRCSHHPSGWVCVRDQLPDDDLCVLIAFGDGEVWTGFLDAGVWRYVSSDPADGVTHWMSFPAPPTGP